MGVIIALDRNMVDYLASLRRKVLKWKDAIQIRKLLGEETLQAFNITIMKIMEYLLLTTTFFQSKMSIAD